MVIILQYEIWLWDQNYGFDRANCVLSLKTVNLTPFTKYRLAPQVHKVEKKLLWTILVKVIGKYQEVKLFKSVHSVLRNPPNMEFQHVPLKSISLTSPSLYRAAMKIYWKKLENKKILRVTFWYFEVNPSFWTFGSKSLKSYIFL